MGKKTRTRRRRKKPRKRKPREPTRNRSAIFPTRALPIPGATCAATARPSLLRRLLRRLSLRSGLKPAARRIRMEPAAGHDRNADQIAYWNGPGGQHWADRQQTQDVVLAPVSDALIARAGPKTGERI